MARTRKTGSMPAARIAEHGKSRTPGNHRLKRTVRSGMAGGRAGDGECAIVGGGAGGALRIVGEEATGRVAIMVRR